MDYNLYNESYDSFYKLFEIDNASILEIGCGPGNITKYLLSKRPNFEIYGVDIAPNMIVLAKKNNPTARFDIMDSRKITEIHGKFDGIVCGFCMPYLSPSDCEKLINDSYDLLVDNGLFYLSFVEGNPKNSGFQTGSSGDRMLFYYHSPQDVKSKLIEFKFKEIQIFNIDYKKYKSKKETHIVLIGRKKTHR